MTDAQALSLAQSRWGIRASIEHTPTPTPLYAVGYVAPHSTSTVTHVGTGETWEAAFAAADEWMCRTIMSRGRLA